MVTTSEVIRRVSSGGNDVNSKQQTRHDAVVYVKLELYIFFISNNNMIGTDCSVHYALTAFQQCGQP